jgi:hypothetical protein
MSDNRQDNLVARHVDNLNTGRAQRLAARVAEREQEEKQLAKQHATLQEEKEQATQRATLTSLDTTQSSSTATPCTLTHPADGPLPGRALAPGGALVHGGASPMGTRVTVSPTSITGTWDTAPIDGDKGMPVLEPSVELQQEPVLSLSTTAINQADGEFS